MRKIAERTKDQKLCYFMEEKRSCEWDLLETDVRASVDAETYEMDEVCIAFGVYFYKGHLADRCRLQVSIGDVTKRLDSYFKGEEIIIEIQE